MNIPSLLKRVLIGAGLALAALAPAALSGPSADAQTAPTLSPLRILALGTEATVSFTSSEPAALTITYQPKGAPISQSRAQVQSAYTAAHEVKLAGLTSNTAYSFSITARTSDGRLASVQGSFTTAKRRVRLILDRINITDDGDWIGKGEPTWFWKVAWSGGETGACFPNTTSSGLDQLVGVCQSGSYSEGTFFPHNDSGDKLTLTFAEENFPTMPRSFALSAGAEESDLPLVSGRTWEVITGFGTPSATPVEWSVPQDKEWASMAITVDASGRGGFSSTMDFRFELFHDNLPYPPNHGRAQVRSNF
jgi:hypothetical protein